MQVENKYLQSKLTQDKTMLPSRQKQKWRPSLGWVIPMTTQHLTFLGYVLGMTPCIMV